MVQSAIAYVKKHGTRAHIRGISTSESVEYVRAYYREK